MVDVQCAVCGRTATVDESATTCPSCGAPLAIPVSATQAAPEASAAGDEVLQVVMVSADPTDSTEVEAIPLADAGGEGPLAAGDVKVDTSASDTTGASDEPELVAIEVVEVVAPADAGDVATADGSQDGAMAFDTPAGFEPLAVTYEEVTLDTPSADTASAEDTGDATPAVVLDAVGIDTATGDVVEVVEVFAEPASAPSASSEPATPAPQASEPVAPPAAPVAPAPAAPAAPAPQAVAAPAPAPAAQPITVSSTQAAQSGGLGAGFVLVGLLVLVAVVLVVLYFAGVIFH
jgi:pyruvate dehydrogenase E2 component (dihydrolipoamide acetyltransferase)